MRFQLENQADLLVALFFEFQQILFQGGDFLAVRQLQIFQLRIGGGLDVLPLDVVVVIDNQYVVGCQVYVEL